MAAAARDKTGGATIGARKSTPIVFIGIVHGDGNRRSAPLILRQAVGGFEGTTSDLSPTIRANQPPTLGAASGTGGAPASCPGCCEEENGSASAGRLAPSVALLIFWITNLWSGDRLDDMTLNRAPLFAHRN